MAHYLILAVKVKNQRNPFRPFTFIDLGHVDVILWSPPQPPESFGFYPESHRRILLSAWLPQRARLLRRATFTRVPAYWQAWAVSKVQWAAVKQYLETTAAGCAGGTVRYDAVRFNCLHLAHNCLQIAGLDPPPVPVKRVWVARTVVPLVFVNTVMPRACHSIMDHELDPKSEPNL